MSETVVVVERKMRDDAHVFESVKGDEAVVDQLIERADPSDGSAALGNLVAIYCFEASTIPEGNIFGCSAIGVPAGEFERAQLDEALSAQQ